MIDLSNTESTSHCIASFSNRTNVCGRKGDVGRQRLRVDSTRLRNNTKNGRRRNILFGINPSPIDPSNTVPSSNDVKFSKSSRRNTGDFELLVSSITANFTALQIPVPASRS